MFTLLRQLHRTRLLTVAGFCQLAAAIAGTGLNLAALLRVAARLHPQRIAVTDDREQLTYAQLWAQAETLAAALHRTYDVRAGQRVAIVCRNHAVAVATVFAAARIGAHVFLLNPELSGDRLRALQGRMQFDFVVYDEHLADLFAQTGASGKALPAYHPAHQSVDRILAAQGGAPPLPRAPGGSIVVLTGGTTGPPKSASRRPGLLAFLPPFLALLTQAHLDRCRSIYLATPICHGYGLAFLLIGVALGLEMHIAARFAVAAACERIAANQIQAAVVVPLMLQRMLAHAPADLASLTTIITGSAPLSPALAAAALAQLGPRLYNLYGTSEAGFSILATPTMLARKPATIGRPIPGVQVRMTAARPPADDDVGDAQHGGTGMPAVSAPAVIATSPDHAARDRAVGRLCIRSAWTTQRQRWIETGDLAYVDADGDIFLCGRVDDMIVSGGENVYPQDVEQIIVQHPAIAAVAVFGIPDVEFGQRLKAVVVARPDVTLDEAALLAWLKPRVARYQMPVAVEFRAELPYTSLGKVDKKALNAVKNVDG